MAAVIWPHRVTVAGGVTSILTGGVVTVAWEIAKRNGWEIAKTYPAVLIAAPLAILALFLLKKKD